ncbi:hypothetical protein [Tsukamurella pseudospumae]|uniref:Uncharacterized protein n=1 Tax=Tsukamurella pseudospumae TaxID=239498 RepID=A0A138ABM4_9ACTN|nr:hypothetical protein [Tsukamurella pseudospumae]KXP07810.1 hypothetical protein AXK60_09265 [Tsukamurella pseudospumae]
MTDPSNRTPAPADAVQGTSGAPAPQRPTPWERLPKTIPHTRARTSTAILILVFLGLSWWYLSLRDQFVPVEVQRFGTQAPATAPRTTAEPTYDEPTVRSSPARSSAAASSGASGAAEPSGSGAPSTTVPGGSVEPRTAPSGGTTVDGTTPGGIVLPGGATIPLPVPGAQNTEVPTSGGAPTTTVPAS